MGAASKLFRTAFERAIQDKIEPYIKDVNAATSFIIMGTLRRVTPPQCRLAVALGVHYCSVSQFAHAA